ncbi:hypothetical protein NHX12_001188 [Muraenolepis orangiensis]|uniref:Receptor ligand binding region domain-containing protein n=1 Tax=Muraenolepis orangiensis TaxID=630683 RepID=A0A9Q0IHX7_9TELE|nr:hypothetical protein NHX12_001188 [Muraenolepis orangiensis]
MVAIPTLSLLLVLAEWAGLADSSPHLLLRPSPRERDAGPVMNFNIAVIHAGATVQAEAALAGPGGRVLYPGFGRVHSSLGESVVTQWGSANVIWLQLCDLLAARPLQGLVYEEERPPPTAWGPLAPMLEFVSAQTGLPIVAVGGGAGLGRMPQETGSIFLQFSSSTALQLEVIFEVLEEYDWTAFSVVSTRHHGYQDFLSVVEGLTDGSFIGWEKKSVVILNVTDDPGGARTRRLLKENEAQVRQGGREGLGEEGGEEKKTGGGGEVAAGRRAPAVLSLPSSSLPLSPPSATSPSLPSLLYAPDLLPPVLVSRDRRTVHARHRQTPCGPPFLIGWLAGWGWGGGGAS